eukprot:m.485307 g.485307  ORF g.485307 m.485307 type:complete len:52 (+) comp21733_c0_seq1:2457-2612(+)
MGFRDNMGEVRGYVCITATPTHAPFAINARYVARRTTTNPCFNIKNVHKYW